MIAATYTQGGAFSVADMPIPGIADDEILLRVGASSICGTDLRIIKNGHRKLQPGQTIALGHEFAGVVAEVGARVSGFPRGTRVAVAPNIGCGQCECCIQGLTNMCPDYTAFGITFDGAHAEYVRIPAAAISKGNVVRLPDEMPFTDAALVEPLSCAVNGSRASQIRMGDTVVVIGTGPIGLMHIMLANLSGACRVIVVDVLPHRLLPAKEVGADLTINSKEEDLRERVMHETAGKGADVVICACSIQSVQEESLGLLAPYRPRLLLRRFACQLGGAAQYQRHPL